MVYAGMKGVSWYVAVITIYFPGKIPAGKLPSGEHALAQTVTTGPRVAGVPVGQ
jgi:hypothetical protein